MRSVRVDSAGWRLLNKGTNLSNEGTIFADSGRFGFLPGVEERAQHHLGSAHPRTLVREPPWFRRHPRRRHADLWVGIAFVSHAQRITSTANCKKSLS